MSSVVFKTIKKVGLLGCGLSVSLGLAGLAGLSPEAAVLAAPALVPQLAQQTTEPEESCVALQEVSTGQTEIRKRIENRAITRGNWNTDFVVPTGQNFSYFVALLTPENSATYEFTANLRFETGASEMAFSNRSQVQAGETYSIPFQSPTGRQPVIINARVGGVNGNAYTIAMAACE